MVVARVKLLIYNIQVIPVPTSTASIITLYQPCVYYAQILKRRSFAFFILVTFYVLTFLFSGRFLYKNFQSHIHNRMQSL